MRDAKARVNKSIRLDPDLYERLRAAATERDLSMNFMIEKALEEFLERLIPVEEFRLTRPAQ